jgi:VWFA-related protein
MVVLPVSVTDARGQSVAGLTSEQFRVYDDGRLQPIALFRAGEVPLTVGLIVDYSTSMRPKRDAAHAAIEAFARSGRQDDEMFVVGFSDRAEVQSFPGGKLFTSDPAELAAALTRGTPGGTTALYDAVAKGLRHLPAGRSDRKALVVVTDGGDNASRLKYEQVRDLARASEAVIYGIGLTGAELQEENPNNLKRLCRDSGGIAYFPEATADIERMIMDIARDLRTQYTIGFTPAPPRGGQTFRKVKVSVTSPSGAKLSVRTRAGYSVRVPQ